MYVVYKYINKNIYNFGTNGTSYVCMHEHVHVVLYNMHSSFLSYFGNNVGKTQIAILVNLSFSNCEPCVAGLCTPHADCPPSNGFEDVNHFICPTSKIEDKLTASGRAIGSKHTVEGDSCVEKGNNGTLDITSHYEAGRKQTILFKPFRSVLKTLPSFCMIQHRFPYLLSRRLEIPHTHRLCMSVH